MMLIALAPDWLISWATPLWLISLGVLIGLLVLLVLWGAAFLCGLLVRRVFWRKRAAAESFAGSVPLMMSEGVMLPILAILGLTAAFALVGALAVRDPVAMLTSVARLPFLGERELVETIPPEAAQQPIRVNLRGDDAVELNMEADGLLQVATASPDEDQVAPTVEVGPTQPFEWSVRRFQQPLWGGEYVENLFVTNVSDQPVTLAIAITTGPAYAEVKAVPLTSLSVIGLVLLYVIQATFFRRVSAIALATTKSELAQPLFGILAALGVFLLILFQFLPYNTFGEDIKMLKDSGLTLIMVMGIILGVWSASNSVADEIEGRTALTVLSKPVSRRQFIVGKVVGILWTVALLFLILGIMLVIVVSYKPVYDAREMGSDTPAWTISHLEVMLTVPGLVLAFFEATVLVCISVAISTRLPMLANFVICFSIYVLGHITPLIVKSQIDFAPVVFIGQFIATILPVLDHFNIQAAVAAGRPVPYIYLGWAFVYCLLYSAIAMLVALALFEDRDLA